MKKIVYIVENNDGIIMGVCLKESRAEIIKHKIGKKRWNENWKVIPHQVNYVDPVMLLGGDAYREKKRRKKLR